MTGRCARVDVYRNGLFGSTTLPVFFGPLLGINSQGVRATATARVAPGNASNCMRPWSVADKWLHVVDPVPSYDRWYKQGNNVLELTPHDAYTPASAASPGTGYTLSADLGAQITLKVGNPQAANETIVPGWFLPIDLPDGNGGYNTGANPYRAAIWSCVGQPVTIGDYLPVENGNMVGPTGQGFDLLVAQDPFATWNATYNVVENSCAPGCGPISPRVVPLPVFDMDDFQFHRADGDWSHCPTGGKCLKVVNILGFFAESEIDGDVTGYLATLPGELIDGVPTVNPAASFLASNQLIR